MKNRAKCKKCESIIESFHPTDHVTCKCGEISVDGGLSMRCAAVDWVNFVRVDDEGNEIVVTIKNTNEIETPKSPHILVKADKIQMLDEMIASYDRLPPAAMGQPVTNYDLLSALLIVSSIFKSTD